VILRLPASAWQLSYPPQFSCFLARTVCVFFQLARIFACPAVQTVRTKYSWVFRSPHMSMIDFMQQVDKLSVVKFVTECLELYLTDN